MDAQDFIDAALEREQREGFDVLSAPEQTVCTISTVEFEVNLGGAFGWLHNSAGDRLPSLPHVFGRIGAVRLSQAAARLNSTLAMYCDPTDRLQRQEVLAHLPDDLRQNMTEFEAALAEEDYGTLLEQYVVGDFKQNGA